MLTPYVQAQHNIRKTWFLMFIVLSFVIAIGWGLSYYYNDPSILYIAVGIAFFQNFFAYFFSDKVALEASGAKPIDLRNPQHRELQRIVDNLSISQGMQSPKIYYIDDPAMNAFATGRNPENSAMAFTTGILEGLEKNELEGVAAHELSHIKNRDILVGTVVVVLVGFLAIISDMFIRGVFRSGGGGNGNSKGNGIIMIVGIVFIILSPFIAKAIQLAISRKRELLADATGAEITRYPEGLAGALEKISQQNMPVKKAGTATAHLYFASPFKNKEKKSGGFMQRLFSTHPPIEERIENLRSMNK
jgi:heat shock protein HtpX